ncbi:hypothetical protein COCMIDRAFT_34188 [Bipolaris oryzae ATCC 44560]|uniref:Uncharacterized protein n=1 Tax=Bipolaris oryzae ATCC 44560 TaxID=930090 RepID=W6Z9C2_COCMI|nr:uncharacterized protein COCMIDRAFT_34188 [Bipolaris oryzae ATCC 44560]EUC48312.1 hypothetical protein COCMIDRAFT_34188 [Bipolaris oryzae ATCC 44560]
MSVPVCLPEQYSSSENGLSGSESLNCVQARDGQLVPVIELSRGHQAVLNPVSFVPPRCLSTTLPSPILITTLILKSDFAAYSYFIIHPMLRTAVVFACLACCLACHVTRFVCCDNAAPS